MYLLLLIWYLIKEINFLFFLSLPTKNSDKILDQFVSKSEQREVVGKLYQTLANLEQTQPVNFPEKKSSNQIEIIFFKDWNQYLFRIR